MEARSRAKAEEGWGFGGYGYLLVMKKMGPKLTGPVAIGDEFTKKQLMIQDSNVQILMIKLL